MLGWRTNVVSQAGTNIRLTIARPALLAVAVWAFAAGAAVAGELADFNAVMEIVSAQNRAARETLLGTNKIVAVVALNRLRAACSKLSAQYAGKPPHVFDDDRLNVVMMTDISIRLITADMMVNAGRPQIAWQALEAVRADFHLLPRSAGIIVLADCLNDANKGMHALIAHDGCALDETSPATRDAIANLAANYGNLLDRCNAMANETLRKRPEFRQLIDGAKHNLALIAQPVATDNTDLLHCLIGELRAIDGQLTLYYE